MAVLTRNFGVAEYTADRTALIWSIVNDLPVVGFNQIIKFFLETKPIKYPPLPAEFREQAVIIRKAYLKKSEQPKQLEHSTTRPTEVSKMVEDFLHKLGTVPRLTKERK